MKPPDRAVQRRADARLASIALLGMTLLMHANPAKALLSDLAVFVTSDGTELTLDPTFAPNYLITSATFSFSTIAWPDTAMVTVNATVGQWQPNDINGRVCRPYGRGSGHRWLPGFVIARPKYDHGAIGS